MAYEKLTKYLEKRGMQIKAKSTDAKALKDDVPKSIVAVNAKPDALIDLLYSTKEDV